MLLDAALRLAEGRRVESRSAVARVGVRVRVLVGPWRRGFIGWEGERQVAVQEVIALVAGKGVVAEVAEDEVVAAITVLGVVAGAADDDVVTVAAIDEVVAGEADEHVVAVVAED